MKKLNLFGNSKNPVSVSQYSLGCDHYGLEIPETQAFRIMDAYYEQGGTFLDTAHVYGQTKVGEVSMSEVAVGKWVASNKLEGKVVISDKGAHPDRNNMLVSRINEKVIKEEIAASLEALRTNSVDIWFLHRDNPKMPVGEIVDMVSELVDKGYVKHLGVSNWSAERIAQALDYAQKNEKHPFEISQIQWSLGLSTAESWEDETVVCMDSAQQEWYKKSQFPLMAFSPQAHGIFSKVIEKGVQAVSEKSAKRFLLKENLESGRIENCRKLCLKYDVNPAALCLSYLTSATFPAIPVVGCSSPEQVRDSLKYSDFTLSEADREYLVKGE